MNPASEKPSPVSEPRESAELHGLGWAWAVIAIASAALLLFNATSVRSWVAQEPPGVLPAALQATSERWWAFTDRLGLTAPRLIVGRLWSAAGDLGWPIPKAARSPRRQR